MSENAIQICCAALALVGGNTITSFGDDLVEAEKASQIYEPLVRAKLTGHPWRFATVTKSLGARIADTPPEPWSYAFQMPTVPAVLEVDTVLHNGEPISYEIEGDKVFCDESGDLFIRYLWRVTEDRWPPWFTWAITLELAAAFADALDRTEKAAELRTRDVGPIDRAWFHARKSNSQQQTTKKLTRGRLIAGRMS